MKNRMKLSFTASELVTLSSDVQLQSELNKHYKHHYNNFRSNYNKRSEHPFKNHKRSMAAIARVYSNCSAPHHRLEQQQWVQIAKTNHLQHRKSLKKPGH